MTPWGGRLSVTARIALLAIALALLSNLALIGFLWKQTHDVAIAATRREMVEQSDALIGIWRDGEALERPRRELRSEVAFRLCQAGG